jgi:tRNA wybutosine-synthesizing protein 1
MEDLGRSMQDAEAEGEAMVKSKEPREMVTSSQAAALKKEGYKLIGTHSAVKLCRWTKHQLRGRGGCYKHTFYGITSYQCMEATPSLACANKCVFCWRHHKNPVGKEWKWKTDDPHYIVDEAVKTHVQMIKETKGIPGVNTERWKEAHTVRHCALSLVGEPIMYPRINELLTDLHHRQISTFLVTNGQHPKAIDSLIPVTQLYVSVDAPTPESLVAIDRPLFFDAWDRLKQSLELLKDKGQRTVARLTVVKGWNSDEVEGYAKLIALGQVSLIEVKGVTFCGKSDASNLNMSNTPWHHEVVDLVKTLKFELDRLREAGGPDAPPEYDLACEHKHSVSVLLARVDQFAYEGEDGSRRWKTWIDYPKFQELAAKHEADPTFTFSVKDYVAETPSWALFGSEEEGFDPTDQRHRKKQKYPKYTRFDERGVPTHDHESKELSPDERRRLSDLMDQKMKEVGCGSTVTELKGGEKIIEDASLMFRGQVIVK